MNHRRHLAALTGSTIGALASFATTWSTQASQARAACLRIYRPAQLDIGDRVKTGDLLATIVAPELDHQISQADATLVQLQAALDQAEANQELARVTWDRDHPLVRDGWFPQQRGTVDVQTLKASEAAVGVARANVAAQEAQLKVLRQQKVYQRVVASKES